MAEETPATQNNAAETPNPPGAEDAAGTNSRAAGTVYTPPAAPSEKRVGMLLGVR